MILAVSSIPAAPPVFLKGVILSHTNMGVPSMTFLCEEYGFGDVVLHTSAMFHAAPLLFIIAQLLNGGRHVIIPGFDPKAVVDVIRTERVTDALLVPSMVQVMVNHPGDTDRRLLKPQAHLVRRFDDP